MTRYMTFAESDLKPKHPERTARRGMGGDDWRIAVNEWRTREAMARAIRAQERTATLATRLWVPYVPLEPQEGHS